jgi:hypothetical protein
VAARCPARGAQRQRGVARLVDGDAANVQGGGAGHDDEEPDDAGHQRAHDDVDPLIAQVLHPQALVDGV